MKGNVHPKIILGGPLVLLLILTGSLWQTGCLAPGPPAEKITVGSILSRISGLLYVAQDQGYFKAQGLDVDIKTYASSPESLKDLKAGHIDLACCGIFNLVKEALAGGSNLRALTVLCNGQIMDLIASRDRGIREPADLRGKAIGLMKDSAAEYFLGVFLTLHHLTLQEVRIVAVKPFALGEALATGEVDAVVAWEPYIGEIVKKMGNAVVTWPSQEGQDIFWVMAGRREYLKSHFATMEKLLRALEQASKFIKEHPAEAKKIMSRRATFLPADWDKYPVRYDLFLDQGLLLHMEDEAAWLIHNRPTDRKELPNFMDYLDPEPLLKVNPRAVRLALPGSVSPH
jgi:NitT/TauT family transport system substrate-binding protein